MRYDRGFFLLWRMSNDHWLNEDHSARHIWFDLLRIATFRPTKVKTINGFDQAPAGTVITSRSELALLTGYSEMTVRRVLKLFENDQMVILQKNQLGTRITICNWDKYQSENSRDNQQNNQQPIPLPIQQPIQQPIHLGNKETSKQENNTPLTPHRGMTPGDLMDLWNENCGSLRPCRGMTKQRGQMARSRLLECPDKEDWISCVKAIAACDWCRGDNERGWVADFDFLVRTRTMVRFKEGFFEQKRQKEEPKRLKFSDFYKA